MKIRKEITVWVEIPIKVKIVHEGKNYNPANVSVLEITPFKDKVLMSFIYSHYFLTCLRKARKFFKNYCFKDN